MEPQYVSLTYRSNGGWPWPESSWGLDPMYGEDGWCRDCGVPQRKQSGSMVLMASGLPKSNLWMPYLRLDALCLREPAASALAAEFGLTIMPVRTPKSDETGIVQLLPEVTARAWYAAEDVQAVATAKHGASGRSCDRCGTWRWLPVLERHLPAPALDAAAPFVASPEWFGDGCQAFRHLLFRRPLADALVALNPRVWSVMALQRKQG